MVLSPVSALPSCTIRSAKALTAAANAASLGLALLTAGSYAELELHGGQIEQRGPGLGRELDEEVYVAVGPGRAFQD